MSLTEAAQQRPVRPLLRPANVTAVGPGITVKGRLTATEHVIIEGVFEGHIVIPDHGVAIGGAAHLRGDVCAKAITVLGRVGGNLTAFALIELRAAAELQDDVAANADPQLVGALLGLAGSPPLLSPEGQEVAELLRSWDGITSSDSRGAAAFQLLIGHLLA